MSERDQDQGEMSPEVRAILEGTQGPEAAGGISAEAQVANLPLPGLTFGQLLELVTAMRAGAGDDRIVELIQALREDRRTRVEAEAEIHALAMKKAMRPSNEIHPNISAYNPHGENNIPGYNNAKPRPDLKCAMFLGQYPLLKDTLTYTEIELLNDLEPGIYFVTKSDQSQVRLTVQPFYSMTGVLQRLRLMLPAQDDGDGAMSKHNYPSLIQILVEALAQQKAQTEEMVAAARRGVPRAQERNVFAGA